MSEFWAPGPTEWQRVADSLKRAADDGEPAGLDSEFYGLDVTKESTVHRSRIHVYSVAVFLRPAVHHPRGYRRAFGAVLPVASLEYMPLRAMLEDGPLLCAHNLPVDHHSFANHGVLLGPTVNTLEEARWFDPHRVASSGGSGFGLKALKVEVLGKKPGRTFEEIVSEPYEEFRSTWRAERRCECGMVPCRKRGAGHERHDERVETVHSSVKYRQIPLQDIGPDHPRWEQLLPYAAEDAVDALELHDYYANRSDRREMPW